MESIKIDVFATKTLQVFQASESIKRNKYAFMRRDTVINEIVNNINLGCNGMLLYGRRRIGKTTVLYNLDIFLSTDTYNIIYISMQNARYNTSLENNFIPNLITKLEIFVSDFPNKTKNTLEYFYDVLSLCNKNLIYNNKYIIICIDEYEGINENMINGTFNVNLLTTIRESIKNHSNIFWLFSGSNRLSELKTIQWTSYFISFKTVEILPFTFIETKYLLTQPFKYADSENLKNTKINVWDKGSIEKIYEETNGWPYFVQAIAHAAIEILKSDQARSKVDLYILENAFRKVIQSSYNSFERLLKNECEIKGEWEYILEFTNSDLQLKPSNPLIRESLKRRLIIKEVDNMWKINMPLMERWLKMYY
ncbi:MAG: AAA family ATPase [Clostridiales bacterium]